MSCRRGKVHGKTSFLRVLHRASATRSRFQLSPRLMTCLQSSGSHLAGNSPDVPWAQHACTAVASHLPTGFGLRQKPRTSNRPLTPPRSLTPTELGHKDPCENSHASILPKKACCSKKRQGVNDDPLDSALALEQLPWNLGRDRLSCKCFSMRLVIQTD